MLSAQKYLLVVICGALLIAGGVSAHAESSASEWANISEGEAAIVLFIEGDLAESRLTIEANGIVLDDFAWITDLPIIKQYRVPAGTYTFSFPNGSQDTIIKVGPGQVGILQLEWIRAASGLRKTNAYDDLTAKQFLTDVSSDKFSPMLAWNSALKGASFEPATIWPIEYWRHPGQLITISMVPDRRPPPPPKE